jgi:formamidopyrimidine-DNA glycosylase
VRKTKIEILLFSYILLLFKEMEYARRLLARFLIHTHITKVSYPDADGLARRFMNCAPTTFADGIVNRKILDIKRHGKHLWFEMACWFM